MSWKLSRTVLRGADSGNAVRQLDQSSGLKYKQPFSIGMADDSVFAFAGLWESWVAATGDVVETYTILTTKPNGLVAEVHNRMPAILKRDDYGLWLDRSIKNPSVVSRCLEPFDAALMKKYPRQHSGQPPEKLRLRMRARDFCRSRSDPVLMVKFQARGPRLQINPLFP